jgi:hypothetical protein
LAFFQTKLNIAGTSNPRQFVLTPLANKYQQKLKFNGFKTFSVSISTYKMELLRLFCFSIFLTFQRHIIASESNSNSTCSNSTSCASNSVVYKSNHSSCDVVAAKKCEYDLLICKLFTGPADDPATMCRCGGIFYGECLRLAGVLFSSKHKKFSLFMNHSTFQCETHPEVGALTSHEIYMKTCIDLIIRFDCPSSLMCAMNCASDTTIDAATTKIIPFNNYGAYYLRIRICNNKVHSQALSRFPHKQNFICFYFH